MPDIANNDTIKAKLAKVASDLVAIAFEVQSGPMRDGIVAALENIIVADTDQLRRARPTAEPRKRGRPRKSTNGGEAEAPASVE